MTQQRVVEPLGDRILIRPNAAESIRPSGIIIPEIAREIPREGIVVAVGPGILYEGERTPPDVVVGDTVLYGPYGGNDVKTGDETLLLLMEREVIAVVRYRDV